MANKLPTTLGDALPTPRPQRTVQGYDSQSLPNAQYQAGQAIQNDASVIQQKQDKDSILDAQKRSIEAKKKLLDVLYGDGQTEGLYSAKGGAAMGSEERYTKAFETIKTQTMEGVQNPRAQKALDAELEGLNLSNLDNVKRFEMTERKGYTNDLTQAQQSVDAQRAGMEYNNQNTIDGLLISADRTGQTNAKLKGYPIDSLPWKQEIIQAKSQVLSSQLLAMSRSKDMGTLLDFSNKYEQYRKSGALTQDAVEKFDQLQSVLAPKINAAKRMGEVYGQQVAFKAPEQKLIDAVLTEESHGDPNAVSPKGAIGLMQITPDTALHLAGGNKAIADEILKNPETNKVAGAKYLGDLTKQFGDQRMALMAYNAGPTILQDWIDGTNKSGKNESGLKIGDPKNGEVTVDQFLAQVPFKETREYVGKVMKTAGYSGRKGPIDMDTATAYAAGMDEQSGAEFVKMVKQNNEAYTAQTKADVNGTASAIVDALTKSGGDWTSIPPDVVAHAKENGSWNAVKDYDPSKPSNSAVVSVLYGMTAKELSEFDLGSPEVVGGLSPADRIDWTKKKNALTDTSMKVTTDRRKTMVEKAFAARGLEVGGKGDEGDENRARFVRVNELIDQYVDVYSKNNSGRMPDETAMRQIVDNVFIDKETPTSHGFFGLFQNEKAMYDITIDDIDSDDRKAITDALNARGIAATDSRVIRAYIENGGQDTRGGLRKEITDPSFDLPYSSVIKANAPTVIGAAIKANKYVRGSSGARTVGDFLSVFGSGGSIGTDPRDMTEEQKAAAARITGE